MEFSTKTVGNKTKYFIDNKEVTENTYFLLIEDQYEYVVNDINKIDVDEEYNECPKCSMIREIAEEIMDCGSVDEAFEDLHELIDYFEEIAYQAGYKEALRNQAEILLDIANQLDEEE